MDEAPESATGVATPTPTEQAEEHLRQAEEELKAAAEAQSPAEPQDVPEGRPHSATVPVPEQVSDTAKRVAEENKATQIGPEGYKEAESAEAARAAEAVSRVPILLEGTRVQIVGGPNAGRMAYVTGHVFETPADANLFVSASPEKIFAKVTEYEVRTRDGRTDLLTVTPDQIKVSDSVQGWGRGAI